MSAKSRPTLESLATELGVSRQTISNAINRPEVVAPSTLARVRAHIEAAGYVPSRAARQLRTARSHTVGFRVMPSFDGINGHILSAFLHELVEEAGRDGYHLAAFSASDDVDEIATYERMFAAGGIDGVVLTGTHQHDSRIDWLVDRAYPFVSFGRPWTGSDDDAPHDWVDVDGARGTYEATRALHAEGYRRIGYLTFPPLPGVPADRFSGWQRAVAEIPDADVLLMTTVADTSAAGMRGALELLDRGADALVCASDALALGAISALQTQHAPAEAASAVVGFDDTPAARAIGLSSVRQPIVEAARASLQLLLSRLSGRTEPEHILLPPDVVLRNHEPMTLLSEQSLHQQAR